MNPIRNGNQRPQRRRPPNGRPDAAQRQRQNGSGNAHRNYERYLALAREAQRNGDGWRWRIATSMPSIISG